MTKGILLALFAYASYSWSDALVKSLGGGLSVFEIGFFSAGFTGLFMYFAKPAGERWREFLRMKRPWAVHARALAGVTGGILGVFAFTTIPLAEVYALIFLAPLFVTILSTVLLKEKVGPWRWFAVFAGFVGVMLVVRPGFRDLQLGHLAAMLIAFLAALSLILLRSLSSREKLTSLLGTVIFYGLILNGLAMAATRSVALPDAKQFGVLVLVGLFSAVGQVSLLFALRLAPANRIAPTHYSQIAWAVVIGALFFQEYPDWVSLAGLAVVGGAGLLTLVREEARLGTVRWNPFSRNQL